MSDGTTRRRSSWWIWLFLLALLFLLWWCLTKHSGMIQNNVAACVAPTMQNAGLSDKSYRVDGRDVYLEGDVDAGFNSDALVSNLGELDCTNTVVNKLNPIAWQPASMQLTKNVGQSAILTGNMPNQESIDSIQAAAVNVYGEGNVENQMQITANTRDPLWLNGMDDYINEIKLAEPAGIDANDERILLTGTVRNAADKASLGTKADAAFLNTVPVTNNISVMAPTDSSNVAYRLANDGKVTLTGSVRDQAAVDTAVAAAGDAFGADNVINQLTMSDMAKPAPWLAGLAPSLGSMTGVGGAALMASDNGIVLEGMVETEAMKTAAGDSAQAAFSGLSIDNRIGVLPPAGSAQVVMDMPGGPSGNVTLTGVMPSAGAVGEAGNAAGMLFSGSAITNNMTTGERINDPVWLAGLGGVVQSYGDADNGRITASDEGIILEGVVDTGDKRTAIGSAAAATGLTVDNRITVSPRDSGNVVYRWMNDGQRIQLTGELANQGEVDSAAQAAANIVGGGNVDNQLTVGDRLADSDWLSGVNQIAPDMASRVKQGVITASAAGVRLEGIVEADGIKSSMGTQASSAVSGISVDNMIQVIVPVQEALVALDLRGIQFETNSANLTGSSTDILDQAVMVLTEYPDVRVEVAGHTDSQGGDDYNLDLSSNRTQSVVNYLTSRGIAGDRLVARGYGESQPIADNDSSEGRAMNRRIEFNIIEQ